MSATKTVAKLDLVKENAAEYAAPKTPALVTVKPAKYLAVTGKGDPKGDGFQGAIGALYAVAFTMKMARKQAGRDYGVAKLEALFWIEPAGREFMKTPRGEWRWTVLIRTPDFIGSRDVASTIAALEAKGKPRVGEVELLTLKESRCVQMLHVGPYEEEAATIAAMKAFAESNDLAIRGRHHEIYLSDPRRVAPSKLRTILRLPVG